MRRFHGGLIFEFVHSTSIDQTKKGIIRDIQGEIEFINVTFCYPSQPNKTILKNFNLKIRRGESIGIVGSSGCGKSTIIQLLLRFYDPKEGEILIDNINIKEYDLISLRKQFGVVTQDTTLFKESLLENIKYGNMNATYEEVLKASSLCLIDYLIKKEKELTKRSFRLSLGEEDNENMNNYDVPISGGEKQRMAIGRIILKDPAIILLDEVTSALDQEKELFITNMLNNSFKNKSKITIAHKLNTIETCDSIIVMDNGEIIEKGCHSELMDMKGVYYNMNEILNKK